MPDAHELGVPAVSNGIALCKIHHTAYDQNFVGISPDYIVHVNNDLLEEKDGPMLKHGIQEMNGRKILIPSKAKERPNVEAIEFRFTQFSKAN
jgi:putative restriction endonuclease